MSGYSSCRKYQDGPSDRGAVPTDQRVIVPHPLSLCSDNGPEYVSKALFKWAVRESLDLV